MTTMVRLTIRISDGQGQRVNGFKLFARKELFMTQATECAALIGLDWGHETSAVCVLPAGGGKPQSSEIQQTAESIAAWVAKLREQFDGHPVAICLEQVRGALVYALMQYDFLVL